MSTSVAIIGAGWYGCHLALVLREKGFQVTIYERGSEVFCGSSGGTQFRLHLGLHYPRSWKTRQQIRRSCALFEARYPHLLGNIHENIYAVSQLDGSHLDYGTYLEILNGSKIPHVPVEPSVHGYSNLEGAVKCTEKALLVQAPKTYFQKELADCLQFNHTVEKVVNTDSGTVLVDGQEFDWCLNCTYNQAFKLYSPDTFYEPCLTLVYQERTPSTSVRALTVMDGPFPSLYPYLQDNEQCHGSRQRFYTLTNVQHTPLGQYPNFHDAEVARLACDKAVVDEKRVDFEHDILQFYPKFHEDMQYHSFFTSMKTKFYSSSANREVLVQKHGRVVHVLSGKVNTIFEAEERILQHLMPGAPVSSLVDQ